MMLRWRLLTIHREDILFGSQSIANHLENQYRVMLCKFKTAQQFYNEQVQW